MKDYIYHNFKWTLDPYKNLAVNWLIERIRKIYLDGQLTKKECQITYMKELYKILDDDTKVFNIYTNTTVEFTD